VTKYFALISFLLIGCRTPQPEPASESKVNVPIDLPDQRQDEFIGFYDGVMPYVDPSTGEKKPLPVSKLLLLNMGPKERAKIDGAFTQSGQVLCTAGQFCTGSAAGNGLSVKLPLETGRPTLKLAKQIVLKFRYFKQGDDEFFEICRASGIALTRFFVTQSFDGALLRFPKNFRTLRNVKMTVDVGVSGSFPSDSCLDPNP
jgi:hypothetical protein